MSPRKNPQAVNRNRNKKQTSERRIKQETAKRESRS